MLADLIEDNNNAVSYIVKNKKQVRFPEEYALDV